MLHRINAAAAYARSSTSPSCLLHDLGLEVVGTLLRTTGRGGGGSLDGVRWAKASDKMAWAKASDKTDWKPTLASGEFGGVLGLRVVESTLLRMRRRWRGLAGGTLLKGGRRRSMGPRMAEASDEWLAARPGHRDMLGRIGGLPLGGRPQTLANIFRGACPVPQHVVIRQVKLAARWALASDKAGPKARWEHDVGVVLGCPRYTVTSDKVV